MSKPVLLVGRTEIIAAIYNPEYLPSAVIKMHGGAPYCLHSFREEDLSFFEYHLEKAVKSQGCGEQEVEVQLYKFFEDYPTQDHGCIGCNHSEKLESHSIEDSAEACTKTTEDCA